MTKMKRVFLSCLTALLLLSLCLSLAACAVRKTSDLTEEETPAAQAASGAPSRLSYHTRRTPCNLIAPPRPALMPVILRCPSAACRRCWSKEIVSQKRK